jgi:hypothetical protein
LTDILSYRFGSLNMIPDVTPSGVFYLPPTGWLTSFYNPPLFFNPSNSNGLIIKSRSVYLCLLGNLTNGDLVKTFLLDSFRQGVVRVILAY